LNSILNRKITLESYLIVSTSISVFLLIIVAHVGLDIFLGYPIVIANTIILFWLGRLIIHPYHAAAIGALATISLAASIFSPTPFNAILSQILGVSMMSIYYFSMLVTTGWSLRRWMELYSYIAFGICLFGLAGWVYLIASHDIDGRLKSIFAEPSLYVYTTLPAVGFFMNCWMTEKRYGRELLIFVLSYILADSSLGFFGLLLTGLLAGSRHVTFWRITVSILAIACLTTGLYLASGNFRLRARDTAIAIATRDVSNTNGSTFALLSNFYVAGRAFLEHPLSGVGIGGYRYIYDIYILDLPGINLKNLPFNLNKDDANSLFLRVAAELGLPGLLALLSFLITCSRVKGPPYREVRNAMVPYFIVRMSRFGSYFSLELYFFAGIYLLNYLAYRRNLGIAHPPSDVFTSLPRPDAVS
jgi:O-antigen ligase